MKVRRMAQRRPCENVVVVSVPARPLNASELRMLSGLLDHDFPGAPELRAQVPYLSVVRRCGCGCPTVEFTVSSEAPRSPVEAPNRLAPIEGRVTPKDDEPTADIILFDDAGRLTSLEYGSYNDSPPEDWPPLDRVTFTTCS